MSTDNQKVLIRTIIPIEVMPRLLEDGLPRKVVNFFSYIDNQDPQEYGMYYQGSYTIMIKTERSITNIVDFVSLDIETNLKYSDLNLEFIGSGSNLLRTLIKNRNILHGKGMAEVVKYAISDITTQGEVRCTLYVNFKRENVIIAENWRFLEFGSGMLLKPNEDVYLDRFIGWGEAVKITSKMVKKIVARCEELFEQKPTANLGAGIVEELIEEYRLTDREIEGIIIFVRKHLADLRTIAENEKNSRRSGMIKSMNRLADTMKGMKGITGIGGVKG